MTISLKIQRKQPIVFLLVLFCAMLVSAEIVAHPPCDDFLKLHDKKPKYLEFIQCKKTQNAQIPVLQAKYRVKWKNIVSICLECNLFGIFVVFGKPYLT
ncbi:DUF4952 domain-containing protein [Leptospira noguchii]|uniref:DUF4952 domain-containing protein n=1 Tax=Leptospira noguchii TaxID=28182 RepID=UPI000A786904